MGKLTRATYQGTAQTYSGTVAEHIVQLDTMEKDENGFTLNADGSLTCNSSGNYRFKFTINYRTSNSYGDYFTVGINNTTNASSTAMFNGDGVTMFSPTGSGATTQVYDAFDFSGSDVALTRTSGSFYTGGYTSSTSYGLIYAVGLTYEPLVVGDKINFLQSRRSIGSSFWYGINSSSSTVPGTPKFGITLELEREDEGIDLPPVVIRNDPKGIDFNPCNVAYDFYEYNYNDEIGLFESRLIAQAHYSDLNADEENGGSYGWRESADYTISLKPRPIFKRLIKGLNFFAVRRIRDKYGNASDLTLFPTAMPSKAQRQYGYNYQIKLTNFSGMLERSIVGNANTVTYKKTTETVEGPTKVNKWDYDENRNTFIMTGTLQEIVAQYCDFTMINALKLTNTNVGTFERDPSRNFKGLTYVDTSIFAELTETREIIIAHDTSTKDGFESIFEVFGVNNFRHSLSYEEDADRFALRFLPVNQLSIDLVNSQKKIFGITIGFDNAATTHTTVAYGEGESIVEFNNEGSGIYAQSIKRSEIITDYSDQAQDVIGTLNALNEIDFYNNYNELVAELLFDNNAIVGHIDVNRGDLIVIKLGNLQKKVRVNSIKEIIDRTGILYSYDLT